MASFKEIALRKIGDVLGLDADASLPELVEFANENFDAGVKLVERPVSEVVAIDELTLIGGAAERAIEAARKGTKVAFYRVLATPPGKPTITAFVVVSSEPAQSS
jgi:hypothetical protein